MTDVSALAASSWVVWAVAAAAIAGVILRPFAWPEWIWACLGAALLVVLGLLPAEAALQGVASGIDVYLFLIGMMLLAELARQEGLFDWLAAHAVRAAQGSALRLFALVYGVGIVVTVFLSNDATAVVLTPAVAAAVRTARSEAPMPHLLACAFVANAASFVLPISNPANLVIYGSRMPPLLEWLPRFALPSLLAIGATFLVLWWTQWKRLAAPIATEIDLPELPAGGQMAAWGVALATATMLGASALDLALGLPACLAGLVTAILVGLRSQGAALRALRGLSWGVLPLVAGLFMLVKAIDGTGATRELALLLESLVGHSAALAAWVSGGAVALATNLANNLPVGLVAGQVLAMGDVPEQVRASLLVAVNLGPNLSVTGSLATILWLVALRRDGHHVSAMSFLRLGAVVMPPALVLAIAGVVLSM